MAVVTRLSRQRRMQDFFNLPYSKYVLIGKNTTWTDDNNPPAPTGLETSLDGLIGAKLISNQWYVKALTSPTQEERDAAVYFKGTYYYKTQDPTEAVSNGCTSIIIEAVLDRDELPLLTYRQVGLQVKVNSNATVMTGDQFNALADTGTLEVIDNRKPQTRAEDQEEQIKFLIMF